MADLARNLVTITKTMSNPGLSCTAADLSVGDDHAPPAAEDRLLRDLLKRCAPETVAAARRFRRAREAALVEPVVRGVLVRYVEPEQRARLLDAGAELRLQEDLGLDSLTLIELAMTLEDVLQVPLDDETLRSLRTLGDINRHVADTLKA